MGIACQDLGFVGTVYPRRECETIVLINEVGNPRTTISGDKIGMQKKANSKIPQYFENKINNNFPSSTTL
jgi:hypothetical protein